MLIRANHASLPILVPLLQPFPLLEICSPPIFHPHNPNSVHHQNFQTQIKASPSKAFLPQVPAALKTSSSDPWCFLEALLPLCLCCFTILARKTQLGLGVECRSECLVRRKELPLFLGASFLKLYLHFSHCQSPYCRQGIPLPRKPSPGNGPPPQPINDWHSWGWANQNQGRRKTFCWRSRT